MRKATGSYRTYSSLVKLQPRFLSLPLGRIAALVPEFAVKDLPLGRTLMMILIRGVVAQAAMRLTTVPKVRVSEGWRFSFLGVHTGPGGALSLL